MLSTAIVADPCQICKLLPQTLPVRSITLADVQTVTLDRLCSAYDADLVMKVTSGVAFDDDCGPIIARGTPVLFDPDTRRPIFGHMLMCRTLPDGDVDLINTLQYVVREMLHILVRHICLLCMHARLPSCCPPPPPHMHAGHA